MSKCTANLIPKHVAIIMDGNGRWAKKRLMPRAAGHRSGAKAVRRAVEYCVKHKISALTLFAMSVENKNLRPKEEVQLLLGLFFDSLQKNTSELDEHNVKIRVIGDRTQLEAKLQKQIEQSEKSTIHNKGLDLTIAINYSGRWDIMQACKRIASDVSHQQLNVNEIDEALFNHYVCLKELPEPDLLIRTGGEQRISNFMLWQLAYSEMYFTEHYWPDFDEKIFQGAVDFYAARQRRFGKTSEQLEQEVHA